MSGDAGAALIVTAQLPAELQAMANALREAHFPPERNYLEAHVTLFHAIPGFCRDELRETLARIAKANAPPPAMLEGLMSLGGGTAIRLSSPALLELRDEIAERFHGMLSAQDGHRPRLHVTIQNKVTSREAKALQAELSGTIAPRRFAFHGLAAHIYRGGPWEALQVWPFRS